MIDEISKTLKKFRNTWKLSLVSIIIMTSVLLSFQTFLSVNSGLGEPVGDLTQDNKQSPKQLSDENNEHLTIQKDMNDNKLKVENNNLDETIDQKVTDTTSKSDQKTLYPFNNIEGIQSWKEILDNSGVTKELLHSFNDYSDTKVKVLNGRVELIIGMASKESLSNPIIADRLTSINAKKIDQIDQLNAMLLSLPINSLNIFFTQWRGNSDVRYIEPNGLVTLDFLPNDPKWSFQWGPQRIKADLAWDTQMGDPSEVLVAVIDTGIDYTHPDLLKQYVPLGYDWVNNDSDPLDDCGHGTHCAGIITATINNALGLAGVANVSIMAEKGLDNYGTGFYDDMAKAIIHAVDAGAIILSNSWGGSSPSSLIHEALTYATENDVIIVASAGNSASSSLHYPSGYPEVISVSAIDNNDSLADFSTYGETIEVTAPGVDIFSTMPTYHVTLNEYGYQMNYDYASGTSMSCPHTAAVTALIVSEYPDWSAQEVRWHLTETAEDLGTPYWDQYFGYGLIDAYQAVQPPPDHNIKVNLETLSILKPDYQDLVNISVINRGQVTEPEVEVLLLLNRTIILTATFFDITPGNTVTSSYLWIPQKEGIYNLTVYSKPVANETILFDNIMMKKVMVSQHWIAFINTIAPYTFPVPEHLKGFYESLGLPVIVISKTNNHTVTEDLLSDFKYVFLNGGPLNPSDADWSSEEICVLENYIKNGGTVVAHPYTSFNKLPKAICEIGSKYGITFIKDWLGRPGGYTKLVSTFIAPNHPLTKNVESLKGMSSSTHLKVKAPAIPIFYDLTGFAIYGAAVDIEKGRLLVLSDDLSLPVRLPVFPGDNEQFYKNILTWPDWEAPEHDLKVFLDIERGLTPGTTLLSNISVYNRGKQTETNITVELSINGSLLQSFFIPELQAGHSILLSHSWLPNDENFYNITAYVKPITNSAGSILEHCILDNIDSKTLLVTSHLIGHIRVAYASIGNSQCYGHLIPFYHNLGYLVQKIPTTIANTNLEDYEYLLLGRPSFPGFSNEDYIALEDYISNGGVVVSIGKSLPYWPCPDISDFAARFGITFVSPGVGTEDLTPYIDPFHPLMRDVHSICISDTYWHSLEVTSPGLALVYDIDKLGVQLATVDIGEGSLVVLPSYSLTYPGLFEGDTKMLANIITLRDNRTPEHDLVGYFEEDPTGCELNQTQTTIINASLTNRGLNDEHSMIQLQLYINDTIVDSLIYRSIRINEKITLSYNWIPTTPGTYNITVYAVPLDSETIITNNQETLLVTIDHPKRDIVEEDTSPPIQEDGCLSPIDETITETDVSTKEEVSKIQLAPFFSNRISGGMIFSILAIYGFICVFPKKIQT